MLLEIEPFAIVVEVAGKQYRIRVKQTALNEMYEEFTLTGVSRTVIFRSNRPLLRRAWPRKKNIDWKLTQGSFRYATTIQSILRKLEVEIFTQESPGDWSANPKNSA